jgi:hypothetical protein
MTLIVVIFVVAVTVGAVSLWWIHKDELAETASSVPAAADEVPAPPARAVAVPAQRTNSEIRAWGRANGHPVSDRGPLPKALVAAYSAAHAG